MDVTHIPASKVRDDLSDVVSRVAYGGERIVVERRGKDVAAVISVEDLKLLERLIEEEEDRIDLEESQRILSDPDEERISWKKIKRERDLQR